MADQRMHPAKPLGAPPQLSQIVDVTIHPTLDCVVIRHRESSLSLHPTVCTISGENVLLFAAQIILARTKLRQQQPAPLTGPKKTE